MQAIVQRKYQHRSTTSERQCHYPRSSPYQGQCLLKDQQDLSSHLLCLKLEPGHEFQKKIEDEVPSLLAIMRHPAPDSITRSPLQAVGQPHSWLNMSALFGWMMDVILIMERIKEISTHYQWEEG
ncbi:MAG: HEC/Ndc80p family-domain-containing protein [Benniella sp.]|nr:MAG: HEC/Ndc80p family-domain-containing protein [Benniella sp.]